MFRLIKVINLEFKKLKNIKSLSILIYPEGAGAEAKHRKISALGALSLLTVYTAVVFCAGFLILSMTPAKKIVFPGSTSLTTSDLQQVKELNKRVIFLARQLESLKTTNKQLKDAILLGDSTLIDSLTSVTGDSSSAEKSDKKFGGDIFYVLNKLFSNEDNQNKKSGGTLHFSMPLNGFISRGFSPETGHMGIDIVAKKGSPIFAAAGGYVVFSDFTARDGNMIIINDPDGYMTIYKHCSSLLKKTRDTVIEGEVIALSGNSGEITTGPHLHFEIWKDGKPIDPKTVLINY